MAKGQFGALNGRYSHGGSYSPEYQAWKRAKQRCHNPKNPKYPIYGGRGITMCDLWRRSFQDFFDHIGPIPSPKHTLDRKNTNKGYEPGNVRWATYKEQNNNRNPRTKGLPRKGSPRKGVKHHDAGKILYQGKSYSVSELAKVLGVNRTTIYNRLKAGNLKSMSPGP